MQQALRTNAWRLFDSGKARGDFDRLKDAKAAAEGFSEQDPPGEGFHACAGRFCCGWTWRCEPGS